MRRYYVRHLQTHRWPNIWDACAFMMVASFVLMLMWWATKMSAPYHLGDVLPISLSPSFLPSYALRTFGRMLMALCLSLMVTLLFGTLAAKSKTMEKLLIPLFDILQSVPVLGFQSISLVGFLNVFPNSLLGPECAAIFALFTAQVWNMIFSFYQSLRSIPPDLMEVAALFRLNAWQRFWRIEVPFAMPGLLWNTMVSMSAGWFFIVAAEAITVSGQHILLPGMGSYIMQAITEANQNAVINALLTMLIMIVLYDQILFRPLMYWSEKFKLISDVSEESAAPWVTRLLRRTQWLNQWAYRLQRGLGRVVQLKFKIPTLPLPSSPHASFSKVSKSRMMYGLIGIMACSVMAVGFEGFQWMAHHLTLWEIGKVLGLGLMTALRVVVLIALSALVWVPAGVAIGSRPRWARWFQPFIQLMAAFPANLFFPVVVMCIVKFHLNVEIWTAPLMVLGAQWYILFNVIAGTLAVPKDLRLAMDNLGVKGWLWWRKFMLPAIYPYFITGAIAAAGGAWNASIVAEVVTWGDVTLQATGLGAYITNSTGAGDFPRVALGITVMCVLVLVMNRFFWRPLYETAIRRYTIQN